MNGTGIKHNADELYEMLDYLKGGIGELVSQALKKIILFDKREHHDLEIEYEECDNRLRFIMDAYSAAFHRKFGIPTLIMILDRTQEEQDNIYLNVKKMDNGIWVPDTVAIERYKIDKPRSAHQAFLTKRCRATDFRCGHMTVEQKQFTDNFFSDLHIVYTGEKKTMLRHSVGQYGEHYHAQVDADKYTSIGRID